MNVYGYLITNEQIEAALADCRARGAISLTLLEAALIRAGVPEEVRPGGLTKTAEPVAYRAADRILQRCRNNETLRFRDGRWSFTVKGTPV